MITKRKVRQKSSGRVGIVTEIPSYDNHVVVAVADPSGHSAVAEIQIWSVVDADFNYDLELLPEGA